MDEREGKYINPYTDYGFERAIRTAEAKGREEGRAEDARKMKADNMPAELIAKYTGLSTEEIAAL